MTASPRLQPTIGADVHTISVPFLGRAVTLSIWDTGGEERYSVLQPMFYRHAQCGVLVFSLSDSKSFENITTFYAVAVDAGVGHFIVAANKGDLPAQVEWADAKRWCDERGLRLIKTSAVTGANVLNLFQGVAEIVAPLQPEVIEGIRIGEEQRLTADHDCCK
jgi:small GTP-binding protein